MLQKYQNCAVYSTFYFIFLNNDNNNNDNKHAHGKWPT